MRTLFALLAGVCVLASCAGGDEALDSEGEGSAGSAATKPVSPAGLEQARRELTPVLRRDTAGLSAVTAHDGSQMMATGGRFGTAVVVRRNADGTTTKTCVDDVDHAVRLLAAPPTTLAKPGLELR